MGNKKYSKTLKQTLKLNPPSQISKQALLYKINKQTSQQPNKLNNKFLLYTKLTTLKQYHYIYLIYMKTKKKSINTKPIPPLKLINVKTLQPQKIVPPTTQKPYMTIEENIKTFQNTQTHQNAHQLKGRFSFSKKSYHQRMEEHNLSPFSNDGRSQSPKYRKTPQKLLINKEEKEVKFAINLKELQKKKLPPKTKVSSARDSYSKKSTTPSHAKTVTMTSFKQQPVIPKKKPAMKKKKSDKSEKQQKARIEFQNEFLSMMNTRVHKQKITEMSDEQGSIKKKKPALQICIQTTENNSSRQEKKLKQKKELVKTMQIKVMKDIQRDYPNLDATQKRVICAVIIVQRLWRQRKVKQFFEHYVTPKASPQCSFRESLHKESSNSTMNLLAGHVGKKDESKSWQAAQIPRKKPSAPLKMEDNFLMRQKSEEESRTFTQGSKCKSSSVSSSKQQSKLNEKVNKLFQDSILSFENQNQKIINQSTPIDQPSMIKFIQCYRQIKLSNSSKKKTTKSKQNIFSMKQSLSEKCLMQKYYNRIFSDRPQKDKPKNYELFSLNNSNIGNQTLKKNQQSSIELFKQINKNEDYLSPQKLLSKQQEQVWIRNQTSYGQQQQDDSDELKMDNKKDSLIIVDERDNEKKKLIGNNDQILFAEGFFGGSAGEIKTESYITDQQVFLSPKKELFELQNFVDERKVEECGGIVINKSLKAPESSQIVQQLQAQQNTITSKSQPQQYSLKSIQSASQSILTQLLSQFFTEYLSFQQKQCLVKKHRKKDEQKQKQSKPKLPGIQISQQTITQYLNILIPFILTNDREQVLKSLQLFHPFTYQKCHRVQSIVYQLFQIADQEEDDEIYWNIITNQGFFACLEEYWKNNVILTKQKEKFTNFLDLTYKVYNRCITDAFSQLFNKQVLEKVFYPWTALTKTKHSRIIFSPQVKSIVNTQLLETIAQQVKQKLLKQSFCYSTTGGKLIKKDRKPKIIKKQYEFDQIPPQQEFILQKLSDDEFTKVMKIADDEFLQDQKDLMNSVHEKYQICGALTEAVLDQLLQQIEQQLLNNSIPLPYNDPILSKSQQQVFLETNETLQNNYNL